MARTDMLESMVQLRWIGGEGVLEEVVGDGIERE